MQLTGRCRWPCAGPPPAAREQTPQPTRAAHTADTGCRLSRSPLSEGPARVMPAAPRSVGRGPVGVRAGGACPLRHSQRLHPDAPRGAFASERQSSNTQTAVTEGLETYLAGKLFSRLSDILTVESWGRRKTKRMRKRLCGGKSFQRITLTIWNFRQNLVLDERANQRRESKTLAGSSWAVWFSPVRTLLLDCAS